MTDMNKWMAKYNAPAGAVWVCGACGKNGKNSTTIGDESCFLNAVLCDEASVVRNEHGIVIKAEAFKKAEQPQ